ncbi:hypothetical protein GCM10027614_02310 [Micromonospora vulcania]
MHLVRQIFDNLPRQTQDDWEVVAAHLRQVPDALDRYAATLRRSAQRGQLVARRQVLVVADQCSAWTTADFYGRLVAGYPGGPFTAQLDLGARLATAATAASPPSCGPSWHPPRPRSTASAASSTGSPPAVSSARRSTWTRCTPTAGSNWTAPPASCVPPRLSWATRTCRRHGRRWTPTRPVGCRPDRPWKSGCDSGPRC